MSFLCREVRATHDLKCLWLSCLVIFAIFSDVLLAQAGSSCAWMRAGSESHRARRGRRNLVEGWLKRVGLVETRSETVGARAQPAR